MTRGSPNLTFFCYFRCFFLFSHLCQKLFWVAEGRGHNDLFFSRELVLLFLISLFVLFCFGLGKEKWSNDGILIPSALSQHTPMLFSLVDLTHLYTVHGGQVIYHVLLSPSLFMFIHAVDYGRKSRRYHRSHFLPVLFPVSCVSYPSCVSFFSPLY